MSTALMVFRPACLAILSAFSACSRINPSASAQSAFTASAPIGDPVASNAIRFTDALASSAVIRSYYWN